MAEGEYVEIQCEGATPEDEGRIQWFFNNQVCILYLNIKIKNGQNLKLFLNNFIFTVN